MAAIKKTYLKKNNDIYDSVEKENCDPFDKLISSPLKQDVQFKPLSFWKRKRQEKSKHHTRKVKCGLYMTDSDDADSPANKKKKLKYEYLEEKSNKKRKLQMRDSNIARNSNSTTKTNGNLNTLNLTSAQIDDYEFKFVTFKRKFNEPEENIFYSTPYKKSNSELEKLNKVNSRYSLNDTKMSEIQNFSCKEYLYSLNDTSNSESQNLRCEEYINSLNDTEMSDSQNCSCEAYFNSLNDTKMSESQNLSCEEYPYSLNDTKNSESQNLRCEEYLYGLNDTKKSESQNLSCEKHFFSTIGESTLGLLQNEITLNLDFEDIEGEILLLEMLDVLKGQWTPETTVLNASNNSTFDSDSYEDSTICHVNNTELKVSEENKLSTSEKVPQKDVIGITSLLSDMTIKNDTVINLASTTAKSSSNDSSQAEDEEKFSAEAFRFVTTRRRYKVEDSLQHKFSIPLNTFRKPSIINQRLSKRESGFDKFEVLNSNEARISIAWDRFSCMPNPIFESTRVVDTDEVENLECSRSGFGNSIVLKPGKQWTKSLSVLKQIQNESLVPGNLESTRIKGRKFQSFVQEIMEMQNDFSGFSTMIPETTAYNKTLRNQDFDDPCLFKSALEFQDVVQKESGDSSWNASRQCTKLEKMSMNHTVKVVQPESSLEAPSAFRNALKLDMGETRVEDTIVENGVVKEDSSVISPKDFILAQCGQEDVLPFEDYFNEKTLKNCKKIGEGVYGEVFMCNSDTVIKIIPIEGADKVNGEPQKKFEEILSEVVIAMKLSSLREGEKYRTSGFSEMKRCWCVMGKYPKYLLDLWDEYDQTGAGSENDSPVMFKSDQLYIVLELANGGKCLESYVFNSSEQSLSVFIQTAFSLAVAEKAFEFEHRDLHWGNVLISRTPEKFTTVVLDETEYKIPTKGVKVSIIDFTLSRISHEGCCIFNDLSVDPSLFASQGDYQFEIYRMMQGAVRNDWSAFVPKTNLFWLHYTLDKMLKEVHYKNKKAQVHKKYLKQLRILENIIFEYNDSSEFVLNQELT